MLNILIAEDNPTNQKLVQCIVTKDGHKASVVSNGQEALDAALKTAYDVVLMDIQMPEMDGVEAMQKLNAFMQDECPPIVALTAHAMLGDREKYLGLGFDFYIPKPLNRSELRRVLSIISNARRRLEEQPIGLAYEANSSLQ